MSKTMKEKNGGPAFPRTGEGFGNPRYDAAGMSLRDYFAAKAVSALIGTAAAPCMTGLDGLEPLLAKTAYQMADAMLKARA
jgi:hypothetical protein